jgi:hypothetical protein
MIYQVSSLSMDHKIITMLWFLLLWCVGIVFGIGVQMIVAGRLVAVNIVPPVAGELLLVENCSVGAQEFRSLITFASIVAHMVGLATGLDVGVHSGNGWDAGGDIFLVKKRSTT